MSRADDQKRKLVMVRIPAGVFSMGSRPGHGDVDEFPLHEVWLDDYLIGRHLVTAYEYAVFLNSLKGGHEEFFELSSETTITYLNNKFYPRRECSDHPANGVTWHGAGAYCLWLSEKTGKKFRLPTEAEWEKAARGGLVDKRYPWGNLSALGMAQFGQTWVSPKLTLSQTGVYQANPFGLFDMVGNVWEWCSDWYERDYYRTSPAKNPSGPENGTMKVLRGGSWRALDVQVRCGIRVGEYPDISESSIGFRLCRSV